jgi:hypothetical protein
MIKYSLLGKLCHLLAICHSKKKTSANAIIGAIGAHLGMCFENNCYLSWILYGPTCNGMFKLFSSWAHWFQIISNNINTRLNIIKCENSRLFGSSKH